MLTGQSWGASKRTLLTIYKSLIRPLLLYGSTIYDERKTSFQSLNKIQYKALCIACQAMKGTALSALLIHCGEKPLALHSLERKLKMSAKIKWLSNDSTKHLMIQHWTEYQITNQSKSLRQATAEFWKEQNGTIEEIQTQNIPPWVNRNWLINTEINDIPNSPEKNVMVKAYIENKLQQNENNLVVYADASHRDEKTGVGIYVRHKPTNFTEDIQIRLNDDIDTKDAEAFAIYYAALRISSYNLATPATLFTDSLVTIQQIEEGNFNKKWIITNTINTLRETRERVEIIWIPSHHEINGHEKADILAKNATMHETADIILPTTIESCYDKIERYVKRKHQEIWTHSESKYKEMRPTIEYTIHYTNKNRRKENIITRLQLGKCRLNHYLHIMKRHDNGLCSHCMIKENIEHYLTGCTQQPAKEFRQWQINHGTNFTVPEILDNAELQEIIYDAAKERNI